MTAPGSPAPEPPKRERVCPGCMRLIESGKLAEHVANKHPEITVHA